MTGTKLDMKRMKNDRKGKKVLKREGQWRGNIRKNPSDSRSILLLPPPLIFPPRVWLHCWSDDDKVGYVGVVLKRAIMLIKGIRLKKGSIMGSCQSGRSLFEETKGKGIAALDMDA
ncbi:hypothetical protein RHMOL_Rhmol08G0143800 [Rhododendron molle]|uniref:Uncharacterized protein n=1 Tax=Rhododendron molle TaxID=49168 RepID=A0ACC0MNB7_RHOML|nr:hypothetical protein RHMOL_Rhmol08G0143800 [Rhododendron molle]